MSAGPVEDELHEPLTVEALRGTCSVGELRAMYAKALTVRYRSDDVSVDRAKRTLLRRNLERALRAEGVDPTTVAPDGGP